jgi:hypothetical protein
MIICTCITDWSSIDVRVRLGASYPLVRHSFSNGEGQITLRDGSTTFTVPSCFFNDGRCSFCDEPVEIGEVCGGDRCAARSVGAVECVNCGELIEGDRCFECLPLGSMH